MKVFSDSFKDDLVSFMENLFAPKPELSWTIQYTASDRQISITLYQDFYLATIVLSLESLSLEPGLCLANHRTITEVFNIMEIVLAINQFVQTYSGEITADVPPFTNNWGLSTAGTISWDQFAASS